MQASLYSAIIDIEEYSMRKGNNNMSSKRTKRENNNQRITEIRRLLRSADTMSEDQYNELMRLTLAEGKRINQNMRSMRPQNVTGEIYDRTMQFLESMNRNTFPERVGAIDDIDDLLNYAEEIASIGNAKTLTLRGERAYRRSLNRMLMRGNVDVSEGNIKTFEQFLSSDLWGLIKKYDSSRIYEAADAIEQGADMDDLAELWNRYEEGELDALDVFEEWNNVSDYDKEWND